MAGASNTPSGEFLTISHAELDRARRRALLPEWNTAAQTLRREAQEAASKWPELPAFDSAWFDADPARDFAHTYNEFAAYAYPAWRLLEDARKLLLADAVFNEDRHTPQALAWTMHVVNHFAFHVQHHDAGLSYSHAAHALANILAYAGDRFSQRDRAAAIGQLENCGEALRTSTRHWLKNLSHMPYNNHFAHHRSGLLAVALVLAKNGWIDEALNGPRNFGELLVGATTDDGLCYESSTVYHFVTLAGLLQTAELAAHHPTLGRDLFRESFANGRCLKQMFDAPLRMLFPGGELPAVGDCYYYRQPMWELRAGLYELAYSVYEDPQYAWFVNKAGERTSVQGLLHGADVIPPGEPPAVRSRLWIEHGYALITSAKGAAYWKPQTLAAFLTGDASGIHHHQDALSIQIAMAEKVWIEDVESRAMELQSFAAPIQEGFNRTMLAQNLVVVDESDQADNPAVLPAKEFKDLPGGGGCVIVSMADEKGVLTPAVCRRRALAVTDDYCLDVYQIAGEKEHLFDWLVHPKSDTKVDCGHLTFTPANLPARTPYSFLRDPEKAPLEKNGIALQWTQNTARFHCSVAAGQSAELLRAQWPTRSDRTGDWREMLMLRLRAPRADFVALYQMSTEKPLWRVTQTQRLFNGQNHEFRIETTNGTLTRRHVLKRL